MRIKINYQINENYNIKKIEMGYLQNLNKTSKIETMKEKNVNKKKMNSIKS